MPSRPLSRTDGFLPAEGHGLIGGGATCQRDLQGTGVLVTELRGPGGLLALPHCTTLHSGAEPGELVATSRTTRCAAGPRSWAGRPEDVDLGTRAFLGDSFRASSHIGVVSSGRPLTRAEEERR